MSGPKVVRIVTRDEIVATCEGLLARLDAVVARWQRVGQHSGVIDTPDLAAVDARRSTLRALLAEDRFLELQAQVPLEISFLENDLQQRLQRAAEMVGEARRADRRRARTGQSLLAALTRANVPVPEHLRRALLNAGQDESAGEAACAQAFALLQPAVEDRVPTVRQRQVAEALGNQERRVSFAGWVASQPPVEDDPIVRQVDAALADLVALAGGAVATPFNTRLVELGAAHTVAERNLLVDSLMLDIAAELKRRRAAAESLARLEELAASLARFQSTAARDIRAQVEAALAAGDPQQAARLAPSVAETIAAEEQAAASAARRDALLQGLARLGYEVHEGVATAWVEHGRVVVGNPTRPGYGVEVGANAGARLQLRAVALCDSNTPRDAIRDRDMETLWCNDVTRLAGMLAEHGDTLTIEKGTPVGVVPLKVVTGELYPASIDDVPVQRELRGK
jgi:hypothetical protein